MNGPKIYQIVCLMQPTYIANKHTNENEPI